MIKVNVSIGKFFLTWLRLTNTLRDLRENEMLVLAALLGTRHELSPVLTSEDFLDRFLFSTEGRQMVLSRLDGYNGARLSTALACLRRKGCILDGNRISRGCIPDLQSSSTGFTLSFLFEISRDVVPPRHDR